METLPKKVTLPEKLEDATPSLIEQIAREDGQRFAAYDPDKKKADERKAIKTNQIRNVFAHINRMRQDFRQEGWTPGLERNLVMLKPRLAYAAGRQQVVKPLNDRLSQAINGVLASEKKEKAIQNFFDLVEGIVAYHKFYGGKD
jgi:CRISPR-associated protein Csm2